MRWFDDTPWLALIAIGIATLVALGLALYAVARLLAKREPYQTIMRLPKRQQLTLAHMLITDHRVPKRAKLVPLALLAYLANPIDLILDFIPVQGYLDDIAILLAALWLAVRLRPKGLVAQLCHEVQASHA
jgi:uncharacterized membrane protein YkvA (DUF1232 family)